MTMQKRLRSLERILAVQKDLQRIAEWKLMVLQRAEIDLQKDQQRLVTFLDEEHSFTPNYAKTLAARLQTLSVREQRIAAEKQRQAERVNEEMRRAGQVERQVETATVIMRRIEDRRELEETLEAEANRKQASLR